MKTAFNKTQVDFLRLLLVMTIATILIIGIATYPVPADGSDERRLSEWQHGLGRAHVMWTEPEHRIFTVTGEVEVEIVVIDSVIGAKMNIDSTAINSLVRIANFDTVESVRWRLYLNAK